MNTYVKSQKQKDSCFTSEEIQIPEAFDLGNIMWETLIPLLLKLID